MSQKVIPLFASPICLFELNISKEHQDKIESILHKLEYEPADNRECYLSRDVYLYNNKNIYSPLTTLKTKILDSINLFNEEVMSYKKTEFEITTSWATRCSFNEESGRHKHCNNMYSAVYYNKCHDNSSKIEFHNNNWSSYNYDLGVSEYNHFNSSTWSIEPRDKLLIVFPSSMYHKISKNLGPKPRYSIACNARPLPPYGYRDSYIK